MQRVVIGTAGHIDHGKTRLLEALTGTDCDRWSEEKERGITIDLGFAHLEDDDVQVSFVDVPGHERFLHNALAGLGGIRIMMLVVAADEGVKPQTREHLDICSLLQIPQALVVMTKRDLVDDDLLELAQLEVEELLDTTPFAGAPVVAVSSTRGDGLDELRHQLLELARQVGGLERQDLPFRLPIDRAFQLRGLGAIVTGTLISGRVEAGESFQILPGEQKVRVRSVQVHGSERDAAEAGERTALQLTGVDFGALERGRQLVQSETFATTKTLVARFTLLPTAPEPLTTFVPIRFHLYSSDVLGKLRPLSGPLEPGSSGWVEIRLAQPVVAVRGDRYIVRRPSPASTLGGGQIVDPLWRRRRGASLGAALEQLEPLERAWLLWVAEVGARGISAAELTARVGQSVKTVEAALQGRVQANELLRLESGRGPRYVMPEVCRRLVDQARIDLKAFFRQDRMARGMPKAQLLGQILPKRAADLGDAYLSILEAAKVLVRDGDLVNLVGRRVLLSGEESELSQRVLQAIEEAGLTPPALASLPAVQGVKPQILEGVQRHLVNQGKLVKLPSGLILATSAMDTLRRELLATGWQEFSVADFKDHFGLSRKWAIPFLEYLDSTNVTRRVGDKRQLIQR